MRTKVRTRRILFGGFIAVVLLGVLVVVAACGAESETSADVALGETIYVEGTDADGTQITRTTEAGILSQSGCFACHGTDGKGRSIDTKVGKFDAPDIRWSVISQPIPNGEGGTDPAYDPTKFASAVREGIDSGGGQLDPVMPRWQLTDPEVNALIAYLQTL
jgi:cytochrome c oxidase subunit II